MKNLIDKIMTKQNSAISVFGMLRHRKPEKSVSVEEMEATIRVRRAKRGMKCSLDTNAKVAKKFPDYVVDKINTADL